jgi:hypothetical protein
LFAFDDTGLGRGAELGLVGEESALHSLASFIFYIYSLDLIDYIDCSDKKFSICSFDKLPNTNKVIHLLSKNV